MRVRDSSIVARTPLSGLPFGAAATKSGAAYVLRHAVNTASRFNLPNTAVALNIGLGDNPTVVTFDSSGATAYVTAQFADRVDVISVASNTVTDTVPVTGDAFFVRVSPDERSIWVSTNVNSVFQIDRETKAVVSRYGLRSAANGMAFSPVNDSLLYVSTLGGSVVEINYKRSTVGRTFSPGGKTQAVVVAPDGRQLYVANEINNEIETFDLTTGTQLTPIPTAGGAFDLVLSPDGTTLWTTQSDSGIVEAFDRTTRQLRRRVFTGGAPRRMAVTPASRSVLVANEAGWVDFIK